MILSEREYELCSVAFYSPSWIMKQVGLTIPMHFFSILQTLKSVLEIISAGKVFLLDILTK